MGKTKRTGVARRKVRKRTEHSPASAASAVEQAPAAGHPDEMLSTRQVAAWLGVSWQWLEVGRSKGYGPKFVRHSYRHVKYRRADVLAYIAANTFSSTAEYAREYAR